MEKYAPLGLLRMGLLSSCHQGLNVWAGLVFYAARGFSVISVRVEHIPLTVGSQALSHPPS